MELAERKQLMPTFRQVWTKAELDANFERLQTKPFEDDWLGYELTVPRGWIWEAGTAVEMCSAKRFTPLGTAVCPDDPDVMVQVSYIITPEVRLDDWPDLYAEEMGYELLYRLVTEYGGRPASDTLLRLDLGRNEYDLGRFTFYRDGRRIFLVACTAPEEAFERYLREFAVIASSLWLLVPDDRLLVEAVEDYAFDGAPVHFIRIRPPAWVHEEVPDLPTGVWRTNLYRTQLDAPEGTISVCLYERGMFPELTLEQVMQSPMDQLRAAITKLEVLARSPEIAGIEDHPVFARPGGYQELHLALDGEAEVMLHIFGLQHKRYWALIHLLTDPPTVNRLRWMQNRRHLEIIMQSLRIELDGEGGAA